MTITYNWKILQMTTNPSLNGLQNVVTSVVWSAEAENTDDSNPELLNVVTAALGGTVKFTNSNSTNFIEYQNLTEQDVLEWIWDKDVNKESVEIELMKKVTLNTEKILPNPW